MLINNNVKIECDHCNNIIVPKHEHIIYILEYYNIYKVNDSPYILCKQCHQYTKIKCIIPPLIKHHIIVRDRSCNIRCDVCRFVINLDDTTPYGGKWYNIFTYREYKCLKCSNIGYFPDYKIPTCVLDRIEYYDKHII